MHKIFLKLRKTKKIFLLFVFLSIAFRIVHIHFTPPAQFPDELYFFERGWYQALPEKYRSADHLEAYPNNEYFYPPLYFFIVSKILNFFSLTSDSSPTLKDSFFSYFRELRFFGFATFILILIVNLKILENLKLDKNIIWSILIFLAMLPAFVSFSSYFNPNLLLLLFFSLFFLCIEWNKSKMSIKRIILLGLLAGLSLLTKFEGAILFVSFSAFLFIFYPKKDFIKLFLIFSLTVMLAGGWWYLLNLIKNGAFYDKNLFEASISQNIAPFSFEGYLSLLYRSTLETFFATLGVTNNIRLGQFGYFIFKIILVLSLIGLYKVKFLSSLNRSFRLKKFFFFLSLSFFLNLIIFVFLNFKETFQPQGRYLYPSLLFISTLFIIGMSNYFKKRNLYLLPVILLTLLTFFNFWGIGCLTGVYFKVDITPTLMSCFFSR